MTHPATAPFNDPAAIARYADGPRRNVPGYDSLLPMVRILLAERMPANGRVLVVGAGGGLELEDMALAHPGWRFDGVDPSQPMLDLAAQRLQSAGVPGDRVALHGGHDGSRNPTGLSLQYADVLAMAEKIAEGGAKILQAPEQREGEPILLGVFRDAEGNEVFMTQYIG